MKPVSLVILLLAANCAFGQNLPGRERGRFSIQGGAPTVLTVDQNIKHVLVAYDSGMAEVFPFDQKIVNLRAFITNKKPVTGGAFMPDGKTFLLSSGDGTVKTWDTLAALKLHAEMEKSGEIKPPSPSALRTINAHIGPGVSGMSLSTDGKLLITAGGDNVVKIWEPIEGKLLHTLKEVHGLGGIKAVTFAPDGRHFATAGGDKSAKIWHIKESGVVLRQKLEGHEGAVNSISFSPDGNQLATASGVLKKSGSIRIWNTESGKVMYKLEGPTDNVTVVLFSTNGELLASAGYDLKLRVWNLADKTEKYYDEHAEPVKGLTNTPDGKFMGLFSKTSIRWWTGQGK